jgi:hypothetical protein
MIDLERAAGYVDDVRWRFAKTMPEWPHEYTIKAWRPELSAAFESFCQLILDEGVVEPWPPAPDRPIYHNCYLVIGAHKYWAMGPLGDRDPIEGKSVINRELQRLAE